MAKIRPVNRPLDAIIDSLPEQPVAFLLFFSIAVILESCMSSARRSPSNMPRAVQPPPSSPPIIATTIPVAHFQNPQSVSGEDTLKPHYRDMVNNKKHDTIGAIQSSIEPTVQTSGEKVPNVSAPVIFTLCNSIHRYSASKCSLTTKIPDPRHAPTRKSPEQSHTDNIMKSAIIECWAATRNLLRAGPTVKFTATEQAPCTRP